MAKLAIEKLDITKFFSKETVSLIEDAFVLAETSFTSGVSEKMLINVLFRRTKIAAILDKVGSVNHEFSTLLTEKSEGFDPKSPVFLLPEVQEILLVAFQNIRRRHQKKINLEDVLLAMVQKESIKELLRKVDIDPLKLETAIDSSSSGGGIESEIADQSTPILNKYSSNLVDMARRGAFSPTIGRETEVLSVIRSVARRERSNVLLVGDMGIGKKKIIEEIAQMIAAEKVPLMLRDLKLLELNMHDLQMVGLFRERIEALMEQFSREMREVPSTVMVVENMARLFDYSESRDLYEVGSLMKPRILKGEFRLIATIDPESYRKYIESDASLSQVFAVIRVEEPNEEIAVQMVESASASLAKFHSVKITPKAVKASVYLSKRYIPEKKLPEKALDVLDEASSKAVLEGRSEVNDDDIGMIVSEKTGIPVQKLSESEQAKLVNLEDALSAQVIGQDHAVKIVSESIRRSRAGLKDQKKPVGSFLFLGPTGVGKTELAKVLAKVVYGGESAMVRLDMSEYSESHTVQRLFGAPPGYVGYEEGGQLTNPIWEKPYSLILLDEIEKANAKVFDVFLQVLDDGRLTDGKGRTVDFRNTIIIATSNIASAEILNVMESKNYDMDARETLMPVLSEYFRPEFINRFDAVIVFRPISKEALILIAKINLDKIVKGMLEKGVKITYSDFSVQKIVDASFDQKFGARPLLRYIQTNVENGLAKMIIEGRAKEGAEINIDDLFKPNVPATN